jgi:hypothetical protein
MPHKVSVLDIVLLEENFETALTHPAISCFNIRDGFICNRPLLLNFYCTITLVLCQD